MEFTEVDEKVAALNALMSYTTYFPCRILPYDTHDLNKSSKSNTLVIEFINGLPLPYTLEEKCKFKLIVLKGDSTFRNAKINLQHACTRKLVLSN